MRGLAARDRHTILPFPGIGQTLRTLHDHGMRLAIVSSNARANVDGVLGPDIASLIEHYACGASTFGKAAKFARVLKRSGVAARDAIAIGDEVRDLEAAVRAGVASGAVAWGYAEPSFLAAHAPTMLFERVADLVPGLLAGRGAASP